MGTHGLLIFFLALPAVADIYKCVMVNWAVKFSDVPCSKDTAVAFETGKAKSFEHVIGQGYPYRVMPLDKDIIESESIAEHARKIGECIIPDENINEIKVYESKPPGNK